MLLLDYSTSTNNSWGLSTRWKVAKDALIGIPELDDGLYAQSAHFALMRFGHDPDTGFNGQGTMIPGDDSGIIDGLSLDAFWYDLDRPGPYTLCDESPWQALNAVGEPLNGNLFGIGSWSRGALKRTRELIIQSRADHPEDEQPPSRRYAVIVLVDGPWTDVDGADMSFGSDPDSIAADLLEQHDVKTHVIVFGGAGGIALSTANDLAEAGGTEAAVEVDEPAEFPTALSAVLSEITSDAPGGSIDCCLGECN